MTDMPSLVIFDCDGILVDTETLANKQICRLINEAGHAISYETCRQTFVGLSMSKIASITQREFGIDLGDDFVTRWQQNLPKLFAQGVAPIDGIFNALDQLDAAGTPYCVASSGTLAKMKLTLGSAGLWNRLKDLLFSATMVDNGKPAPDLFLYAANKMGFAPGECVVIEDSPFGAMAAKAAGMTCYGYIGDALTNRDGLAAQDSILFDDMRRLPHLLRDESQNDD